MTWSSVCGKLAAGWNLKSGLVEVYLAGEGELGLGHVILGESVLGHFGIIVVAVAGNRRRLVIGPWSYRKLFPSPLIGQGFAGAP